MDAITLAMNMYSHGVDPHLDFSDMPKICEIYERVTRMHVYERTPYALSLIHIFWTWTVKNNFKTGDAILKPPKRKGDIRYPGALFYKQLLLFTILYDI